MHVTLKIRPKSQKSNNLIVISPTNFYAGFQVLSKAWADQKGGGGGGGGGVTGGPDPPPPPP